MAAFLCSCSDRVYKNYHYSYTAEVVYHNERKDTISFEKDSNNGDRVVLYLNSDAGCLKVYCSFFDSTLVCGVRKYKILSFKKYERN